MMQSIKNKIQKQSGLRWLSWSCCIGALLLAGCTTYRTPGAAANIPALAETNIPLLLQAVPATRWPATLAVVRIQAADYSGNAGYGSGNYSVVSARVIEEDGDVARMAALPQVAGVTCLNPLLLPPALHSMRDLRVIAAKVHADLLLVYTVDTNFRVDDRQVSQLAKISLGMFSDQQTSVASRTSGLLVDVNTGYMFGMLDASAHDEQLETAFKSSGQDGIDALRLRTERASYKSFLGQFETLWQDVLDKHIDTGRPAATHAVSIAVPVRC